MQKKTEYTVSGFDVLNLLANIDERQDEVKSASDKWKEEHPEPEKPDYKKISIPLINIVVNNILTGKKCEWFNTFEDMVIEDKIFGKNMTETEEIKPKNVEPILIDMSSLINSVVSKIVNS